MVEKFKEIYKRQRAKGIKEYGMTVEENHNLTSEEWVDYAEEECVDLFVYLERIRQDIREKAALSNTE